MINIQADSNHLLKFLRAPQRQFKIQKKCFPQNTYGVSLQAPKEFHKKHSLINQNGYHYLHENKYATGTDQFHNYTQNKFFTIRPDEPQQNFNEQYQKDYKKNPQLFHRKRGLLSEYMQKNAWMSKVHKLMGFQRTDDARNLSNSNRKERIKNLKKSPNSTEYQVTQIIKKPIDKMYFEEIPSLMNQKTSIRKKRNGFFSSIEQQKLQSEKKLRQTFYFQTFQKKELSKQLQSRAESSRSKYHQTLNMDDFLFTTTRKTQILPRRNRHLIKQDLIGTSEFNDDNYDKSSIQQNLKKQQEKQKQQKNEIIELEDKSIN